MLVTSSVNVLFHFLEENILFLVSFAMQKPLSLSRSHLFIFVFQYFGRWIEKDIASIYMSVLTVFSLRALQSGFPGGTGGKEPTCQCRKLRDTSSIPGSGRSSGEGHDNPLQCSGLETLMDRGAWWAMVHRVAKIWT